jgi:hypothetical protein
MADTEILSWKKCSSCKTPIAHGARYYVCSVSTCNGQRTGYVFCSIPCFERHLPAARHKDAGAVERTAPTAQESSTDHQRSSVRVLAVNTLTQAKTGPVSKQTPKETLVIASRLKDYIAARSEFNTSGGVMDVLSDHLRILCDRAIENARADGRKTVMDRDFQFLKNEVD